MSPNILKRFGTKNLRVNFNESIVLESICGVVGDNNSRGFNFSIMSDTGEIFNDSDAECKLLVSTETDKSKVYYSTAEHLSGGNYYVKIPDEAFQKEQILNLQFMLTKGESHMLTPVFTQKVEKSLIGSQVQGRNVFIDFDKITNFGNTYETKMKALTQLSDSKVELINSTTDKKIKEYNSNCDAKISSYNYLAKSKEKNATDLFNEYSKNINNIKSGIDSIKVDIEDKKKSFDLSKNDFDLKFSQVKGILDAENGRVESENKRKASYDNLIKVIKDNPMGAAIEGIGALNKRVTKLETDLNGVDEDIDSIINRLEAILF